MKMQKRHGKVIFGVLCFSTLLVFTIIISVAFLPGKASADYQSDITTLEGFTDGNKPTENIFILFQGVSGESEVEGHENWCIAESFNQGQSMVINNAVGGRITTEVIFDDMIIVKPLDKASPKLAEAVCIGRIFPKVEIDVTTSFNSADHPTFYSYEINGVRVTSYNISGSGQSEDVPMETLTLSFEEITVTYTEFDSTGKPKGNVEYSCEVEEGDTQIQ